MTYSESAKGQMITAKRVREELRDHGLEGDFTLFVAEVATDTHGMYNAGDVMDWLGY